MPEYRHPTELDDVAGKAPERIHVSRQEKAPVSDGPCPRTWPPLSPVGSASTWRTSGWVVPCVARNYRRAGRATGLPTSARITDHGGDD